MIGSLFTGYGGLDMGVAQVLGDRVAWHAEIAPGPQAILARAWPTVPNLGDVSAYGVDPDALFTLDWSDVEPVDVLTGGFPCQDVSHAGLLAGLKPGTRSGLWARMAEATAALRPSLVVIENVRGLRNAPAHSDLEPCPVCLGDNRGPAMRALGAVLGDLADLGLDARWASVRASDVGAPHRRERVFVLAYPPPPDTGGQRYGSR